MSTVFRLLMLASVVAIAVIWLRHPTQFRALGRKARLIAYLWIVAVLIGAVLQVAGLRGY